jgi:hypothetical protein
MPYPEKMLRGISDQNSIDADGRVSAGAFQFRPSATRVDAFEEASINWYDDEESLKLILNQQKDDGSLQFKFGIAVLPKECVDRMKTTLTGKGSIDYERSLLPDNKYHGNLLMLNSLTKQIRSTISGALAMGVEEIILN